MANINDLPGRPTKTLVRGVRRVLWDYCRCRPQLHDRHWRLTWEWAAKEAEDSLLFQFGKRRRARWPRSNEIASRYLLLCLMEMQACCQLRIGTNSQRSMPDSVAGFMARQADMLRLSGQSPAAPLRLTQEAGPA
ncbi:MAG: hypothetical protein WD066_18870 [Planctomycetaceae bacterium]